MSALPPLYVIFSMDCRCAATQSDPEGPRSWQLSAHAIDGFCSALARSGYPATLFLAPRCADEHEPLLGELAAYGCELGLYVHPPSLDGVGGSRMIGHYSRAEQQQIIQRALDQFQNALGMRAQTFRGAFFSANDDTFDILAQLGFRQGSLSNPGRQIPKHAALWQGAVTEPHYANRENRLAKGDLPFFEVPVSTDPSQLRGGLVPDLAIENGTAEAWHEPLIAARLDRQNAEPPTLRTLCFTTRNAYAYHDSADRMRQTLDAVVDLVGRLGDRYTIVPTTVHGAHSAYHASKERQ